MICRPLVLLLIAIAIALPQRVLATDPDAIGLAPLRREQPALTGTGIPVGQSEAEEIAGSTRFEINPFYQSVSQPVSLFTWISSSGTETTFPNTVGVESGHADQVGGVFFGTNGVSPGVLHVRNYEANDYVENVITPSAAQPDVVVNQSWIAGVDPVVQNLFDRYAATYNVLFVSGMNNAEDTPQAPGSCLNGIGVGRGDGCCSSVGPTSDGRAKPDISVLPATLTSFLTPVVSGAAALLWQAAARNDGGAGTASVATNASIIKALLLNGAIKQSGWTNGSTRPLDARFGAGALDVYNSWLQLKTGRATTGVTNSSSRGWDYSSISMSAFDQTNHYYFNLSTNGGKFVGNITLVWKAAITGTLTLTNVMANFDLQLANGNGQPLLSSASSLDNVEHLFATNLPPGRYDLRVIRRGGIAAAAPSNYALAFDFASTRLAIARSATNIAVSWSVNEAGLVLQSAANLNPPIQWQNAGAPVFVTNGMNTVTLATSNGASFFRLARP